MLPKASATAFLKYVESALTSKVLLACLSLSLLDLASKWTLALDAAPGLSLPYSGKE